LDAISYLEKGGQSQVMNCGYGRGFSVREVLAMMKKVSGVDFKVVESPRRPGDSAAVVADSSAARKVLGWKPKYDDLQVICETAYRWEKKLMSERASQAPAKP
jgi:UDP-glucose 4-epimerase